jgi:hypothetical protein
MARLTHGPVAAATTITLFLVMVSGYSGSGAEGKPSSASQNASERTIEGVWRTVVTLRNCQTGQPVAPSFRGLFTFHEGGTMSEFGVGPGSTPALRSPGHGVWQREHGWQQHSFTFTHYNYNVSGVLTGSVKIRASVELGASGDELTTSSESQILDPNDNVVAVGCATAAGTRLE